MNWSGIYSVMARAKSKYPFYDGTFSYSTPEKSKISRSLPRSRMGWGARAVEMRANKTRFDKFENDYMGLNDLFNKYKGREALEKIKEDILIGGVGFLAITDNRIMPFTALEATGTYDWREQNLSSGIAVFRERTQKGVALSPAPDSYMTFDKHLTSVFENGQELTYVNPTGRPLMTALTHKSTTSQPFGRSVLKTTVRDAIIDASRTKRQALIAAHHYNTKVDVLLGVDSETDVDVITSQTGDILKVGPNDDGLIPKIGEFAQHAMTPFSDTIMLSAQSFCADTKLSLANIGISTAAPQSAEQLEIVGDDLRDDIVAWQLELGAQLKHFAVTLWMYVNNVDSIDDELQAKIDEVKVAWLPIFKPDIGKFGDGLNKMAQYAPAIVEQRSVWRNAGLTSDEIDAVIASIDTTKI